ncbi:MAG: aminoacyl-tRNA hydrolase [Rhodospirillales bacterium]
MLLLVGLGNPGQGYAKNRHNIGFMAIDAIAERFSFAAFREKFQGRIAEGEIGGVKVLVLKPETYMNESGRAVEAASSFYKIPPENIIVFHDEIDLDAGRVRVKRSGGHAGHNGLRSIHSHIGSNYGRVRIGVGHPGDKDEVEGHVLTDFSKGDKQWVERMLDALSEHAEMLTGGEDAAYMNKVAEAINPPKAKKEIPKGDGDGV